jgi:putative toxin-antitoxin system antitoxin component (TIGR02293 family)
MAIQVMQYGNCVEDAIMVNALALMGVKAKGKVEEQLRQGLPYQTVETVMENTGITAKMLALTLDISMRTLMNHKKTGTLSPTESDKIYRFSRIFALAMEMVGGKDDACEWMNEEAPELGGVTPMSLMDTDYGAERVEALIENTMAGIP